MTKVLFRTYGTLARIANANQLEMQVDGSTVQSLLDELDRRFGPPMHNILHPKGEDLSELLYILVNGKNIGLLEGTGTKLKDGDVISVLPVTAGG